MRKEVCTVKRRAELCMLFFSAHIHVNVIHRRCRDRGKSNPFLLVSITRSKIEKYEGVSVKRALRQPNQANRNEKKKKLLVLEGEKKGVKKKKQTSKRRTADEERKTEG